jgi:hypothetical protein
MGARRDPAAEIEFALRRHFSAVFTEQERLAIVARITEWDAQHPELCRSERLSAWLEIARAERARVSVPLAAAR